MNEVEGRSISHYHGGVSSGSCGPWLSLSLIAISGTGYPLALTHHNWLRKSDHVTSEGRGIIPML
jgi:hypothetical protein